MELPRIKIGLNNNYFPVHCADRYTHVLLTGKSGTGKSSLLASWWQQDEFYRNAKVLVEPSGFLSRDCLSISKGKALYCSIETPVSLNPMAQPYHPDQIVDIITEAINQVVMATTANAELTVKMRSYLDEAIKWCLGRNRRSLLNVRDYLESRKSDVTLEGLIARLNHLLGDERMQEILCGTRAPIEWGKFIANRQTLIVDGFGMGKDRSILLGSLVTHGVKSFFRFQRPKTYRPLALYIDEAQNYISANLFDILKEARKFRIGCILSTQNFSTIPERVVKELLNVGTLVTFRVGHDVAVKLAHEMGMDSFELQRLPKYHVAFMTPTVTGIAKAPRPPITKKIEPRAEKPKPKFKGGWFRLEPYTP
ncbi:MAG: hypothetical protein WAN11_24070 [Syntrophobacteraceae bacterium]